MKLGLYIHIPFCHRRCNYCDFYLTTNLNIIDKFVISLLKEIRLYSEEYKDFIIDTIFFGGGTPSLLSKNDFELILDCIKSNFNVTNTPEITVECNPEDIINDRIKFNNLKDIGINRFSIGVQSFIDSELRSLSRVHNSLQAIESVKIAKDIADNVSIDIIYNLQNQQIDDIEFNISKIDELNLNHISAYTLIIEKGTLIYKQFEKKKILEFADKYSDVFYEYVSGRLNDLSFNQYEVSNYSKIGYESKHNLKYWNFEPYLGLGPSSHSFANNKRFVNVKSVTQYISKLNSNQLPIKEKNDLKLLQLKNDYFISVFRSNGVAFKRYKLLFSEDFTYVYSDIINQLIELKLATISDTHFKLTQKGYALADEITLKFFKL